MLGWKFRQKLTERLATIENRLSNIEEAVQGTQVSLYVGFDSPMGLIRGAGLCAKVQALEHRLGITTSPEHITTDRWEYPWEPKSSTKKKRRS